MRGLCAMGPGGALDACESGGRARGHHIFRCQLFAGGTDWLVHRYEAAQPFIGW